MLARKNGNKNPISSWNYSAPDSTFIKSLRKIYLLFLFSNINDLQNRFEAEETSRVMVRDILGFSAHMEKAGCLTYLCKYGESLIIASDKI